MSFVIDNDHRCFPEALQFFVSYVARAALYRPNIFDEDDWLIISADVPHVLRLNGVRAVLGFIRTGQPEASALTFDIAIDVSYRPPEKTITLPADRIGATMCTYLLGCAWERYGHEVAAVPPKKKFCDWDADLQFYRHIRNACFHGGKFNIFDGLIKAPNLPEWHGRQLPEDLTQINGRKVINDFLPLTEVLWVLHDMGNAIDRVLGKLKARSAP